MSPLLSIYLVSLLAALGQDPGAASRRDEARLLNQSISHSDIGNNLRVWDLANNTWRAIQQSELSNLRSKILVINLWAHYCKPCIAEFPVLHDIAKQIEGDTNGVVRFVFISETSGAADMQHFCSANAKKLPSEILYLDYNENIAEGLRQALPSASLSLPTTLILDERRVVRYALIGALIHRRSELAAAITDILRADKLRPTQ